MPGARKKKKKLALPPVPKSAAHGLCRYDESLGATVHAYHDKERTCRCGKSIVADPVKLGMSAEPLVSSW